MRIPIHKVETPAPEEMSKDWLEWYLKIWEWGDWARRGNSSLGYPPCLIKPKHTPYREPLQITDDQALQLDRTIAGVLPQKNKVVVVALYHHLIPLNRLPPLLHISKGRAIDLRNQALNLLYAGVVNKSNNA